MLLVVAVIAVSVGMYARKAKRQESAINKIISAGGYVTYSHDPYPDSEKEAKSPGPVWFKFLFGEHCFSTVIAVDLLSPGNTATNETLTALVEFPYLERLYLECTKSNTAGFCHLQHLGHLKVLTINFSNLSLPAPGTNMSFLGSMKSLESITLCHVPDLSGNLVFLQQLSNLESLWISDCTLSHNDLREIGKAKKLRRLDLTYSTFDASALIHLATIDSMQELSIRSIDINDQNAIYLKSIRTLRFLEISCSTVDQRLAAIFQRMPFLSSITIYGTELTVKERTNFNESLPHCNVYFAGVR